MELSSAALATNTSYTETLLGCHSKCKIWLGNIAFLSSTSLKLCKDTSVYWFSFPLDAAG